MPAKPLHFRPTETARLFLEEMAEADGLSLNAWLNHHIIETARARKFDHCPTCRKRECTCGADHWARINNHSGKPPLQDSNLRRSDPSH